MSDKICAKCGVGWVIQTGDKHCGYCGCAVFDFTMRWENEPLLYAGNTTTIHELTILVENTSAYPVRFDPIQTVDGRIINFPRPNKAPFEVKAGEQHAIPIQLNSDKCSSHWVKRVDCPKELHKKGNAAKKVRSGYKLQRSQRRFKYCRVGI